MISEFLSLSADFLLKMHNVIGSVNEKRVRYSKYNFSFL